MNASTTQHVERATYGAVQVGDSIATYVDRKAPSSAYANGRLWSGTVRNVHRHDGRVTIEVVVHGRSLCADDLVYGFGNRRDWNTGEVVAREVVYHLSRGADEYLQHRVRDIRTGRRYWAGVEVFGSDDGSTKAVA